MTFYSANVDYSFSLGLVFLLKKTYPRGNTEEWPGLDIKKALACETWQEVSSHQAWSLPLYWSQGPSTLRLLPCAWDQEPQRCWRGPDSNPKCCMGRPRGGLSAEKDGTDRVLRSLRSWDGCISPLWLRDERTSEAAGQGQRLGCRTRPVADGGWVERPNTGCQGEGTEFPLWLPVLVQIF